MNSWKQKLVHSAKFSGTNLNLITRIINFWKFEEKVDANNGILIDNIGLYF